MREECIDQLEKIIVCLTPVVEIDDARLIKSRIVLSHLLLSTRKTKRARQVAENNLKIVSRTYPEEHLLSLQSNEVCLFATWDQRKFDKNQQLVEDLAERMAKSEKADALLRLFSTAARQALKEFESATAIEWFAKARELSKKLCPESVTSFQLESAYWRVVSAYEDGSTIDLKLLENSLENMKRILGETHFLVLKHQLIFAKTLAKRRKSPEEPIRLVREALSKSNNVLGPKHVVSCQARFTVLEMLREAGRFSDLLKACDEHRADIRKYSGENSVHFRKSCEYYIDSLCRANRFEDALAVSDEFQLEVKKAQILMQTNRQSEATLILTSHIDNAVFESKEDYRSILSSVLALAGIYHTNKKYALAIERFRQHDDFAARIYPPTHTSRLQANSYWVAAYSQSGEHKLAIQKGRQLLEVILTGEDTIPALTRARYYGTCLQALVVSSSKLNDLEAAKDYAAKYFSCPITHESAAPMDWVFKSYLGQFELNEGNYVQAEKLLLESLSAANLREKDPRYPQKPNLVSTRKALDKLYQETGREQAIGKYE